MHRHTFIAPVVLAAAVGLAAGSKTGPDWAAD